LTVLEVLLYPAANHVKPAAEATARLGVLFVFFEIFGASVCPGATAGSVELVSHRNQLERQFSLADRVSWFYLSLLVFIEFLSGRAAVARTAAQAGDDRWWILFFKLADLSFRARSLYSSKTFFWFVRAFSPKFSNRADGASA
jgi:hypothetical protein